MKLETAVKKMEKITRKHHDRENNDPEWAHHAADEILIKYLNTNGAKDLAEAWLKADQTVGFWYA